MTLIFGTVFPTSTLANSADIDNAAHIDPHLDLHCLHKTYFVVCIFRVLRTKRFCNVICHSSFSVAMFVKSYFLFHFTAVTTTTQMTGKLSYFKNISRD